MTKPLTILGLGFTGTFGRAFTKYTLACDPSTHIRVYSRGEYEQSKMADDFGQDSRLSFMIGDIRDRERLDTAMYGVDTVIHAAALKQVPLLEKNPFEAKKTNVDGTVNVINAAINAGVQRALFISTDKAVRPLNMYGKTKALAEHLWLSAGESVAGRNRGTFHAVRYGNVLGSRGSVVELWKRQYELTGEITITDLDMTRFLLMPSQAAQFASHVLTDRQLFRSGSLFVPSLPTATIGDLAMAVVPGAKQKVVGARRGEKLHEELLSPQEYTKSCMRVVSNVDGIHRLYATRPLDPYPETYEEAWDEPYASNGEQNRLDVEGIRKLLESG